MEHSFLGRWITTEEFYNLPPRNVFYRQLEPIEIPCEEHRNRHILFRKTVLCDTAPRSAKLYISADDYYKLYINGRFVAQGPAPSYHLHYNYNEIDVTGFLQPGENVVAVHTLYQGLVNRVWQSADHRHGLILDLIADGKVLAVSDETFKTAIHTAYTEIGVCGYHTQFLERYDSTAAEVGFADNRFDDRAWSYAKLHRYADHTLVAQKSRMLTFEQIAPVSQTVTPRGIVYDFGSNYVGYLCATAVGNRGDVVTIRCGQELNEDGTVRYALRANCVYEEDWILADGVSTLDWFDYKAFRYAELQFPEGATPNEVSICARHYPFTLRTDIKPDYANNADLRAIWDLCVNTQKYGVQEVIQDCMEREKGFYLGDGCYTALTHMLLTQDDSQVRKLIDEAFVSAFITDTLESCLCGSMMQEIAEFPLMLVYLILWHYNYTHDRSYLAQNYPKVTALLEAYRRDYERDHLLRDLDKWCVVEWPRNFQHGYDVDILEGKVCQEAHVSINAYYIAAIKTANTMAHILGLPCYRDESPLLSAFTKAFYNEKTHLFKDGVNTDHISLVGNSFVYGLGVCTEDAFTKQFLALYEQHGIHSLSLFCTFPVLMGFVRHGEDVRLKEALLDDGAWKRILREGGTTTFEGWGKETKVNASLFHMTMSYAAAFLADVDLRTILDGI